jgi:hypothetical protein
MEPPETGTRTEFALIVGDADNDGKDEIYFGGADGVIRVLSYKEGTWLETQIVPGFEYLIPWFDAGIGDVDNDGYQDLVLAGRSSENFVIVLYSKWNNPPTAGALEPFSVEEGGEVMLNASGTDPDGDILYFTWDLDNDGSFETMGQNVPFSAEDMDGPGNQAVVVQICDPDGACDTATTNVTISNVSPNVGQISVLSAFEGGSIAMYLLEPDDPSSIDVTAGFEYAFDCGDGYSTFSATHHGACQTTDNGTRTIKGKIRDKDGGETEYVREALVSNVAPTATLGAVFTTEGNDINLWLADIFDPSPVDTAAGFEYAFDCGDGYGVYGLNNSIACSTVDNDPIIVKGKLMDKDGGETEYQRTVAVANVAPTLGPITVSHVLLSVGTHLDVYADFTDPGTADTHTAIWGWGDNIQTTGDINQGEGFGLVSGNHAFSSAGVYTLTLTVTDDDGGISSTYFQYITVYDPNGGFVTGGGSINSLEGAYKPNPSLSDNASFGFVSKYKKGSSTPTGNTEFQFKAGNLNFHSSSYDWLVVTGSDYAKYKGVGTINGEGSYKFQIWAGDKESDTFRIKIWEEDEFGVEIIIYDNGFDQVIEGGNIIVHVVKK